MGKSVEQRITRNAEIYTFSNLAEVDKNQVLLTSSVRWLTLIDFFIRLTYWCLGKKLFIIDDVGAHGLLVTAEDTGSRDHGWNIRLGDVCLCVYKRNT